MRKFAAAATVVGAGALALIFDSPALATVTNGGPVTLVSSSPITFQDATAGITVTCTTGSGAGNVPNGFNIPVGTLSSLSLSGCASASPPISFTLMVNTAGSAIDAVGSGVSSVKITGITVTGKAFGGLCTFTAGGGSLNGTYNNLTGVLMITSATGVTVTSVNTGCLGILKKGDVASLFGAFIVTNGSGGHPQIS